MLLLMHGYIPFGSVATQSDHLSRDQQVANEDCSAEEYKG